MENQPGNSHDLSIAIIGGGAAGFFSAINIKDNHPNAKVVILEKSSKVLAKVSISGGGRCNLTNNKTDINELIKAYPRGDKLLRRLFREFGPEETMEWFTKHHVPLVTQEEGCVFPRSQNSESIVAALIEESGKRGVNVHTNTKVLELQPIASGSIKIIHTNPEIQSVYNKVIVTTGGSPHKENLKWLESLGHTIEDPVPSLFPFNIPDSSLKKLMGIVVLNTVVSIPGKRYSSSGALLITHWGVSGPAILKLSSYAARYLNDHDYKFQIQVNWTGISNQDHIKEVLINTIKEHPAKKITTINPFNINKRLWEFLLERRGFTTINEESRQIVKKWGEIGNKGINQLTEVLTNDIYEVTGKSKFREEFVTCGGISLKSININTLESKIIPNLFFAGEVLDIDAITGGYNLQAAWTTGFIAAKL